MAVLERLSEEDTKKYGGQWVAVKNGKVIFGDLDPQKVVAWATETRAGPDVVFWLPGEDEPTDWSL